MELKDIMAISGKPGLFKFISQGRNAMIVENLEDKARTSAFATDKISALEDIAIFTANEEEPLKKVFHTIYELEQGKETISHKSAPKELKDYFSKILPEYDEDRVYASDIKKVIQWYNILCRLELLDFSDEKEEEASVEAGKEDSSGEQKKKTDKKPVKVSGEKKKNDQK